MIHFSTPLPLAILSYIFRIVISITVALISILSVLFTKIATKHCVKSVRARSYHGLYFPVFGLNTERYSVSFRTQSECGTLFTQ